MGKQTVWVDSARCTGCGVCVEVCSVRAIALMDDKARLDDQACTGCEVCVDACPEGAIQPVSEGELVPVVEPPVPTVYKPGPLAGTAAAAAAVAGVGLLMKAVDALARALGHWLMRRPTATSSSVDGSSPAGGAADAGCQARHRRRGGWG